MIYVAMIIFSVLVGVMRGGRLSGLGSLSMRHFWLVFCAFGIQVLLHTPQTASVPAIRWAAPYLYPSAYFLLLFCFALNARVPGIMGLALGSGANMIAIVVNGGKMPVDGTMLAALGHGSVRDAFASGLSLTNTVITDQTRLPWLGDVFCGTPPFPNPTIFSLGDVLLGIGVFFLVQGCMLGKDASAANRPTTS